MQISKKYCLKNLLTRCYSSLKNKDNSSYFFQVVTLTLQTVLLGPQRDVPLTVGKQDNRQGYVLEKLAVGVTQHEIVWGFVSIFNQPHEDIFPEV